MTHFFNRETLGYPMRWLLVVWLMYIAPLARIVLIVPLAISALVTYLFVTNKQILEVCRRLVEQQDWLKLLFGLATLGLFSAALFHMYLVRTSNRQEVLYGQVSRQFLPASLIKLRMLFAFFTAAPVCSVIWPLYNVLDAKAIGDAGNAGPLFLAVAIFSAFVILFLMYRLRNGVRLRWVPPRIVRTAAITAFAVTSFVPLLLSPATVVVVTRQIGPLGMLGLQLLAALAIFGMIASCLHHWKPQLVSLLGIWLSATVITGLVWSFLLILALVAGTTSTTTKTPEAHAPHAGADDVKVAFGKWLDARARFNKNGPAGERYPVFVVAAEGGGIYAASAVAMFLARIGDDCPAFARHVFAISGVSGGSVGAVIHSGLQVPVASDSGCGPDSKRNASGADKARAALQRDHLSPLLGVLVPDFIRYLAFDLASVATAPFWIALDWLPPDWSKSVSTIITRTWSNVWSTFNLTTRERVLEFSIACASIPDAELASKCAPANDPLRLKQSIAAHWGDGRNLHALVLNTTRAESGETVAFAPFQLGHLDANIASFADPRYGGRSASTPVVEAAVASARFPLVMPPYVLVTDQGNLNFVDGGFADNSGAAIASVLFQELQNVAAERKDIDVRLILLTTDAGDRRRFEPFGAKIFLDFWVPIEALLNVRSGVGPREVARAVERYAAQGRSADRKPVTLIRFGTDFFLGWTISQLTLDKIMTQVAPEGCAKDADSKDQCENIKTIKKLVQNAQRLR